MKYIVVLIDGAGDNPLEELGGVTPLVAASLPHIKEMAKRSLIGEVSTVPRGMKPGSDVANLSVLGYSPEIFHTGRSPLEALSLGVKMKDDDMSYRVNLVTLSGEENFGDKVMVDYSGGEISTEEAAELILVLQDLIKGYEGYRIYRGMSYRHVLIESEGKDGLKLTPPHDISGKKIGEFLPSGVNEEFFRWLMEEGYRVLEKHPVNLKRIERGLAPANTPWAWGEGRKPQLANFKEKNGLRGGIITAVDLLKGIGLGAEMEVLEVAGATGTIHTNFTGKKDKALEALLGGLEYLYIHLEAPDECGHQGDVAGKVRSLELIDEKVIGPLMKGLDEAGEDYRVMVVPDHKTPLALKTHTTEPVPYLIYDSRKDLAVVGGPLGYNEEEAKKGKYFGDGPSLHQMFIEKNL